MICEGFFVIQAHLCWCVPQFIYHVGHIIALMDKPPELLPVEAGENLFNQVMDVWTLPEIERRQSEGSLPIPINLRAVQILFTIEGAPTIRINKEVKAIMQAKLNKPKKKGESIYESDVDDIFFGNLLEEDANFAHITMVLIKGEWKIGFNFLYQTTQAKEILELGKEYLDSAKDDLKKGRLRAATNNLFLASENLAIGALSLHPLKERIGHIKTHGSRSSIINNYSHISDIIPKSFAKSHNILLEYIGKKYDATFEPNPNLLSDSIDVQEKFFLSKNSLIVTNGQSSPKLETRANKSKPAN